MARSNIVKRAIRCTWSVLGSAATCGCVIIILPFFAAGLLFVKCQGCIKNQSRQGRRVYLKSESSHPLPLSLRRKFNLSDPNIPLTPQLGSRLMSLPFEIRQKIWENVLTQRHNLDIHYKNKSTRLSCLVVPGFDSMKRVNIIPGIHLQWADLVEELSNIFTTSSGGVPSFALIKTCRQVYLECMPLVYSSNTFRFTSLDSIAFFNQGIRRQWAARLRSLSLVCRLRSEQETLTAWESAWFQVATWMTGLTQVDIEVGVRGLSSIAEKRLLISTARVSGLKQFSAKIWHIDDVETVAIDLGSFGSFLEEVVKRPNGSKLNAEDLAKLERLSVLEDSETEDQTN